MVASQTARGLAAALTRADGAVTLRLNPESLGFVRIKLEMGDGLVRAKIETSTDQARRLLEQSSETLRASLEAKGWEASQVRVELLREADPGAELLRKLEQHGTTALERTATQDADAGQQRDGAGAGGGDRKHQPDLTGSIVPASDDEPAVGDSPEPVVGAAASFAVGVLSRLDTTV